MSSRAKTPKIYSLERQDTGLATGDRLEVRQETVAYGDAKVATASGDARVVMLRGAGITREAFDAWIGMYPLVEESIRERRTDALKRAARVYQPEAVITMADVDRLEMQKKAAESVFAGAEWLAAADIGRITERSGSNPAALAHRWKTDRKVFALNWNGKDLFPRYAFDARLHPLPVIGKILEIFGADMDPWRTAAWFESSNAWLDGRRPREALDQPELLLAAAGNKGGWEHG